MNARTRLGAFVVAVVLAGLAGAAVGGAIGPEPDRQPATDAPGRSRDRHDPGSH